MEHKKKAWTTPVMHFYPVGSDEYNQLTALLGTADEGFEKTAELTEPGSESAAQ